MVRDVAVVAPDNVGMRDRHQDRSLSHKEVAECFEFLAVGRRREDDLQGYERAPDRVPRLVDDTHPAPPELAGELVDPYFPRSDHGEHRGRITTSATSRSAPRLALAAKINLDDTAAY